MLKKTLLLDMDGVLADFVTAAATHYNIPAAGTFGDRCHAEHDTIGSGFGLKESEFWDGLDRVALSFWSKIPPLPWCQDLMHYARTHFQRVAVCTSPPRSPYAAAGKIVWLQNQFGKSFRDFVITPRQHKELCANRHTVLLDDHDTTVERFRAAGGCAVLFPMPWNSKRAVFQRLIGSAEPGEIANNAIAMCIDSFVKEALNEQP